MTVSLSNNAAKYLARLNDPDLSRVMTALAGLAQDPPQGDILPITGQPGYFRLKVGGQRILYKIESNAVCVTHIVRRGQAYTKKNKEYLMTAMREKLHAHIDALPEERLKALTPIIELIAEDYWKPVIEPADAEEIALIDEAMQEYKRNPSSFITLDELKQRLKDGTALQI